MRARERERDRLGTLGATIHHTIFDLRTNDTEGTHRAGLTWTKPVETAASAKKSQPKKKGKKKKAPSDDDDVTRAADIISLSLIHI